MTLDSLQIKHSFSEDDAGLYAAAGLVGRVLIPLSGSLLSVMFPKIVKSKILQEKSHALAITLGLTVCAARERPSSFIVFRSCRFGWFMARST